MNEKYDYLDRLIAFAGDVILFTKEIPNDVPGEVLTKQLKIISIKQVSV